MGNYVIVCYALLKLLYYAYIKGGNIYNKKYIKLNYKF